MGSRPWAHELGLVGENDTSLYYFSSHGRRVIPNVHIRRYSPTSHRHVTITTNPLGLRRLPENSSPKKSVLVLGDSITMADYIDDGKTWVDLLEKNLGEPLLNAGIPDTGTREQISRFEELSQELEPKAVLLMWYLNDSRPPWSISASTDESWFFKNSALYRFVLYRLNLLKVSRKSEKLLWVDKMKDGELSSKDHMELKQLVHEARFDWGAAWDDENQKTTERLLGELKAKMGNRKLLVVITPVLFQVEKGLDDFPQQRIMEVCHRLKIPCFDLLPHLKGVKGYYWDQCHYNERGNAMVADVIAPWVREQLK